LPVFLCSVLITIQIALMINANLIVDYAAFTAARSAIVWIPQETDGESSGAVRSAAESPKLTRITRAATLACLPLSPKITDFATAFVSLRGDAPPVDARLLAEYAAQADSTLPPGGSTGIGRIALDIVQRWPYANEYTTVELLNDAGEPAEQFSPGEYVTVRVSHQFMMQVPLAGPLLGWTFGDRFVPFLGPFYIPISSSYRLLLAQS
jgi:hypothetical protein